MNIFTLSTTEHAAEIATLASYDHSARRVTMLAVEAERQAVLASIKAGADAPHHLDDSLPCVGCGAYWVTDPIWVGQHGLEHSEGCDYLAILTAQDAALQAKEAQELAKEARMAAARMRRIANRTS